MKASGAIDSLHCRPRLNQSVLLLLDEGHKNVRLWNSYNVAGKNPEVHWLASKSCQIPSTWSVNWGYLLGSPLDVSNILLWTRDENNFPVGKVARERLEENNKETRRKRMASTCRK